MAEEEISFPSNPCHKTACNAFINSLGGCAKICNDIESKDKFIFGNDVTFINTRSSLFSYLQKWKLGRIFIPHGSRLKKYECNCTCTYEDEAANIGVAIIDDIIDTV